MTTQPFTTDMAIPALGRSLAALRRMDEAGAPSFQAATALLGSTRRLAFLCRSYSADLALSGVEPYELAPLCRDIDAIWEWMSKAIVILDRRQSDLDE
jgi:hypothetical protein